MSDLSDILYSETERKEMAKKATPGEIRTYKCTSCTPHRFFKFTITNDGRAPRCPLNLCRGAKPDGGQYIVDVTEELLNSKKNKNKFPPPKPRVKATNSTIPTGIKILNLPDYD